MESDFDRNTTTAQSLRFTVSNKRRAVVQDSRIERSTKALSDALIALAQEQEFSRITVQQILDRAGVARATFYAHYRNKEDVLDSSYDRLFAVLAAILEASRADDRLFPVAEFLTHIQSARPMVDALHRATGIAQLRMLFARHAERIIEQRLVATARTADAIRRALAAHMLAGALVELVDWWYAHPNAATPTDLDRAFQKLGRALA
jgi:AcrR family transcriptional regulator